MVSHSTNGSTSDAATWHRRAAELTTWADGRLITRTDAWGAYSPDDLYTAKGTLTPAIVQQHFCASKRTDVIGFHAGSIGPDSKAKWVAADIDAHSEADNPESNLKAAIYWYAKAIEHGFNPLLIDSNGKGGYHLRVLFSSPIPLHVAHFFGHWLFKDDDAQGFPTIEIFPKQEKLNGPDAEDGRYGNWLRAPGRHPKRDHWSRIWDGSKWLHGDAAIDYLLSFRGDETARAIEAYEESVREAEAEKEDAKRATTDTNATDAERHRRYGLAALKRACERVSNAPDLQKHFKVRDQSYSIGHLIPNYLTEAECQAALEHAVQYGCGAEDFEKAKKTIASGLKKGQANPKPPLPRMTGHGHGDQGGASTPPPKAPPKPIERFKAGEIIQRYPKLRPAIIDGLAREGETVNIIANPKVGKSWLTLGLSLSKVTGKPWLGHFQMKPGRVLIIDNELHCETISSRLRTVAEKMEIDYAEYKDAIEFMPLRGNLRNIFEIESEIARIKPGEFSMTFIDAKYRMEPDDANENSNADAMRFYNQLDRYCRMTDSSFWTIHHASKGEQSGKRVTDVGSGAGAQSRAADAHLIIREHEEEGVFVFEGAVRSFPPPPRVAMRWEFPLWVVDELADPTKLKGNLNQQEQKQRERDNEGIGEIKDVLKSKGRLTRRKIRDLTGIGDERLIRMLGIMVREGEAVLHDPDEDHKYAEYELVNGCTD